MPDPSRIALVSGANRGIGAGIANQLEAAGMTVVRGARSPDPADPSQRQLDVTDQNSVDRLVEGIDHDFGRLDVLINNAGVALDEDRPGTDPDLELVRQTIETNLIGSWRLAQRCIPLMLRGGYGRIVNLSSGMGQLSDMHGGAPGYRVSKVSLNAMTRILAHELGNAGIKVNSMCPGWVQTEMGGAGAWRTIDEGADTATWLATLPDSGPTGGFFRNRLPIPW